MKKLQFYYDFCFNREPKYFEYLVYTKLTKSLDNMSCKFCNVTIKFNELIKHMEENHFSEKYEVSQKEFDDPCMQKRGKYWYCLLCKRFSEQNHMITEMHNTISSNVKVEKLIRYCEFWRNVDTKIQNQKIFFDISCKNYLFCAICMLHCPYELINEHIEEEGHNFLLPEILLDLKDTKTNCFDEKKTLMKSSVALSLNLDCSKSISKQSFVESEQEKPNSFRFNFKIPNNKYEEQNKVILTMEDENLTNQSTDDISENEQSESDHVDSQLQSIDDILPLYCSYPLMKIINKENNQVW